LSDFEDEVEDEDGNFRDILAEHLEDVAQLFGGNFNEIDGLGSLRLLANEVFIIDIIALTEQLHELKCTTVGDDALLVMEDLVNVTRLGDILAGHELLILVIEVIVVCVLDGKFGDICLLLDRIFLFIDILPNQPPQFIDHFLHIDKQFVLEIFVQFLPDIVLGDLVST
jgi:hypothetical protein